MRTARVLAAAALVAFAGCSGGDDGGGTGPTPVFTSLTLAPTSPTVTKGGSTTLTATAKDQSGNAMSGLQVTYVSANNQVATVTNAGVVTGVAVGSTDITATGVIGSVTKTANVTVSVSALSATATVNATTAFGFNPTSVTVAANGTVTWNFGSTTHNVTFDAATPTGGNIGGTTNSSASRTFPTPGTYPYQCTIHGGMTGEVKVQ